VDDLRDFDRCLKPELRSSWKIIVEAVADHGGA
jgi:hypothetical protein